MSDQQEKPPLQILVTGQESNKIKVDNGFIHRLDGGSSLGLEKPEKVNLCPWVGLSVPPVSRGHPKQILKPEYQCTHEVIQARQFQNGGYNFCKNVYKIAIPAQGGRKINLQESAGCDFTLKE